VKTDYNVIKWDEHFYLDDTSPSGLRWKREVRCGNTNTVVRCDVGDVAGSHFVHPSGKSNYWMTNVDGNHYVIHRIIWVMVYGKIDAKLVIDHIDGNNLNNSIDNMRVVSQKLNTHNQPMKSSNKSGVTGVNNSKIEYWAASWMNLDGTQGGKAFSIKRLGEAVAFRLACEYRTNQIKLLNAQGANYTDRHGLST